MKEDIIYLRTSTKDQNPDNQLKDCLEIAPNKEATVVREHQSAWKDGLEHRDVFRNIYNKVKMGKVRSITVWDLDRIYRKRVRTVEFMAMCNAYDVTVWSFRQQFFNVLDKMIFEVDKTNPMYWLLEKMLKQVKSMLIEILAWIAEEESNKRSERTKAAVRQDDDGRTISYKGNKWGRKKVDVDIYKVCRMKRDGSSLRQIAEELGVSKSKIDTVLKSPKGRELLGL